MKNIVWMAMFVVLSTQTATAEVAVGGVAIGADGSVAVGGVATSHCAVGGVAVGPGGCAVGGVATSHSAVGGVAVGRGGSAVGGVATMNSAVGGVAVSNYPSYAAPKDYYGALSFSREQARVGISYDEPNQAAAERVARERCGESDCTIVFWIRNACGALAISEQDPRRGAWSWTTGRRSSEEKALNECQRVYGRCFSKESVCTTGALR